MESSAVRTLNRFVLGAGIVMVASGVAASFVLDGWMTVLVLGVFALAIGSSIRAYFTIKALQRPQGLAARGRDDAPETDPPAGSS